MTTTATGRPAWWGEGTSPDAHHASGQTHAGLLGSALNFQVWLVQVPGRGPYIAVYPAFSSSQVFGLADAGWLATPLSLLGHYELAAHVTAAAKAGDAG